MKCQSSNTYFPFTLFGFPILHLPRLKMHKKIHPKKNLFLAPLCFSWYNMVCNLEFNLEE